MIAKLFDHISVQSLVYALLLSLLVLASAFWLPQNEVVFNWLGKPLRIAPALSWPLALLTTLFAGIIFNEINNRQMLFIGNYHILPVFCCLALSLFAGNQAIKASISLLALLVFVLKTYQLIYQKDSKYHFFESGMLAGLLSFWYIDFLLLLPISWGVGLILGKLSPRGLAANITGAVALIYFPVAIGGLVGANLWELWLHNWTELQFGFSYGLFKEWAALPLMLVLFLIFVQLPSVNSKGNNMQRQAAGLWYIMLVLSMIAYLLFANKMFYLALLIFPLARLTALFITNTKNRWLRNGMYLLLFSSVALVIFGGTNSFFFG